MYYTLLEKNYYISFQNFQNLSLRAFIDPKLSFYSFKYGFLQF